VYWVADGTKKIMSFDLAEERITFVKPLPVPLSSFRLAEVHGRLGIAIFHYSAKLDQEKTDVWVLESARGEQRWRRWYSMEMSVQPPQLLTLLHFAHGKHVLMAMQGSGVLYGHEPKGTRKKPWYGMIQIRGLDSGSEDENAILYKHELNGTRERPRMVQISRRKCGTEADHIDQAFAYVETKEPLNNYKL
jgi:hypothetical protein